MAPSGFVRPFSGHSLQVSNFRLPENERGRTFRVFQSFERITLTRPANPAISRLSLGAPISDGASFETHWRGVGSQHNGGRENLD